MSARLNKTLVGMPSKSTPELYGFRVEEFRTFGFGFKHQVVSSSVPWTLIDPL